MLKEWKHCCFVHRKYCNQLNINLATCNKHNNVLHRYNNILMALIYMYIASDMLIYIVTNAFLLVLRVITYYMSHSLMLWYNEISRPIINSIQYVYMYSTYIHDCGIVEGKISITYLIAFRSLIYTCLLCTQKQQQYITNAFLFNDVLLTVPLQLLNLKWHVGNKLTAPPLNGSSILCYGFPDS